MMYQTRPGANAIVALLCRGMTVVARASSGPAPAPLESG